FDEDARTVQRWVQRFEAQGFEGLREGERSGGARTLHARPWRGGGWGGRGGASRLAARVRAREHTLGWQAFGRAPEEAPRGEPRGAPVPAAVPQTRVSAAQAPSPGGPGRSAARRGGKKNCADSQDAATVSCGTWTNATSSNTALALECGYPRRSATRSC